jgi:hypothetical protein
MKLAREAGRQFERVTTSARITLDAVASTVSMPRHRVAWTVEAAERLHRALVKRLGTYRGETWPDGTTTAIAGERHPELYGNGSNEVRLARNQGSPPIPAEIQAFRIGDLKIMCNPGELFNELGWAIKRGVGGDAWVASYCNDYVGYISTRKPYDDIASVPVDEIVDMKRYRRYYGTTTSPFDAGAGEKLVSAEVRLAKRLS